MRFRALRRVAPRQSSFGFFHPNTTYRIQRAGWLHRVALVSPGVARFRPSPLVRRLIDPDFSTSNRRVRISLEVSTRRVSTPLVRIIRRVPSPCRLCLQLFARTLEPSATARQPSPPLRAAPFTVASRESGFPSPPRHRPPTAFQPRQPHRLDRPEERNRGRPTRRQSLETHPEGHIPLRIHSQSVSSPKRLPRTVASSSPTSTKPACSPRCHSPTCPEANWEAGVDDDRPDICQQCAMHLQCKCFRCSTPTISPHRTTPFRNVISR